VGRKARIERRLVIAASTAAADGACRIPRLEPTLAEYQDPAKVDKLTIIVILSILVIYVTMVYGPIAAMLVEMFPTRIRYTSMSLPYHIGNGWFGGLMPATAFAISAQTPIEATINLADGTGADQANLIYLAERTVASGANDDLDLAGSLTDPSGAVLTFARIKSVSKKPLSVTIESSAKNLTCSRFPKKSALV
jgi:hypothetical protein